VIAEDAVLLREDLAKLSASCDCDVVAKVDEHRPDLLVADVRMPPGFTDEGLRAGPGPADTDHRWVLAVLRFLEPEPDASAPSDSRHRRQVTPERPRTGAACRCRPLHSSACSLSTRHPPPFG